VLSALAPAAPTTVQLDALGVFRRSRCWLQPGVSSALVARQEAVVAAVGTTGAVLHKHYRPGDWLPHVTLAPRLRLDQLPTVARLVFEVLPLTVTFSRAALVETSTGRVDDLPHLV
jgi:2'-5' RNA ligase